MNNELNPYQPELSRLQGKMLVAGLLGLVVLAAGIWVDSRQFFYSYLTGYLFWLGVSMGSAAFLMIHHLVNGRWGFSVQRILESAARNIFVMALLFIPLLFGLHELYEWTHPEAIAESEVLQHKTPYLNIPFFIARQIFFFAVWMAIIGLLTRWSRLQDESGDPLYIRKIQHLSAPGLVIFGLMITLLATDLVMSLQPHWFSTIFGMLYMVQFGLSGIAMAVIVATWMSRREPLSSILSVDRLLNLGNFVLAFVMLWAYLNYSQLLIIWSGNLPEEVIWFESRISGGWQYVAYFLALFHFAIPFVLLLNRVVKRNIRTLRRVAIALLIARYVDLHFQVAPALHTGGFHLSWMDVAAPIGIGGIWLFFFLRTLGASSLLPLRDPRLETAFKRHEVVEHG